ncbi:hypothetical protein GE21DRAFT_1338821 [Neurospora crassa]|nr:hypothetical protein GE21DRAFT_1338821 [Neurospora crassa]
MREVVKKAVGYFRIEKVDLSSNPLGFGVLGSRAKPRTIHSIPSRGSFQVTFERIRAGTEPHDAPFSPTSRGEARALRRHSAGASASPGKLYL